MSEWTQSFPRTVGDAPSASRQLIKMPSGGRLRMSNAGLQRPRRHTPGDCGPRNLQTLGDPARSTTKTRKPM